MTYSESLGFEETCPPGLELKLTDNEDATMGGSGMVGNAPPNRARKLKQSTLFVCLFVCLFVWPTHLLRQLLLEPSLSRDSHSRG